MDRKIILASSSPRRIEIMRNHGSDPVVMPADIDETLPEGLDAKESAMFLALKKALSVEPEAEPGSVIIAADTIVYKDGIIGKPRDKDDAFRMIAKIRNTDHLVITGVALVVADECKKEVFCDTTKVFCKDYTDREIHAYIDTDEPYDKAGGYAIQGAFGKYIEHYEGSFENVVGFPWDLIAKKLTRLLAGL